MAGHVLAQVSSAYSDFCFVASKAVRQRHIRHFFKEVEPPTKVVKKDGANEQQPAAAAAFDSNGQGPRASTAGAVDHLVKAMLLIGVYGNNCPKAVLIHLPVGKSSEYSDTDLAGGDVGHPSHVVGSKRNTATMSTSAWNKSL